MDWLDVSPSVMWDRVTIDLKELTLDPSELTLATFVPGIGVLVWLFLVAWPLTGISREDPFSTALYVLYMVASAITLCLRFKGPWQEQAMGSYLSLFFATTMGLSLWRWYRKSEVVPSAQQKEGPSP